MEANTLDGVMKKISGLSALGLLVFALLLGCTQARAEFIGSEWRPQEIGGVDVTGEPEMFVRFGDENRLEGHGGCNRFFGSYALAGDRIDIGPIGATRMACLTGRSQHHQGRADRTHTMDRSAVLLSGMLTSAFRFHVLSFHLSW